MGHRRAACPRLGRWPCALILARRGSAGARWHVPAPSISQTSPRMDPLELLLASHELLPVGDRGLFEHGARHLAQSTPRRTGGRPRPRRLAAPRRGDGEETDDHDGSRRRVGVAPAHGRRELQAQQLACAKALVDVLVEQKALRKAFEPHLAAVCARDVPGAVAMGLNADGHLPLIERVFKNLLGTGGGGTGGGGAGGGGGKARGALNLGRSEHRGRRNRAPWRRSRRRRLGQGEARQKGKPEVVEEDGVFYFTFEDEYGGNCVLWSTSSARNWSAAGRSARAPRRRGSTLDLIRSCGRALSPTSSVRSRAERGGRESGDGAARDALRDTLWLRTQQSHAHTGGGTRIGRSSTCLHVRISHFRIFACLHHVRTRARRGAARQASRAAGQALADGTRKATRGARARVAPIVAADRQQRAHATQSVLPPLLAERVYRHSGSTGFRWGQRKPPPTHSPEGACTRRSAGSRRGVADARRARRGSPKVARVVRKVGRAPEAPETPNRRPLDEVRTAPATEERLGVGEDGGGLLLEPLILCALLRKPPRARDAQVARRREGARKDNRPGVGTGGGDRLLRRANAVHVLHAEASGGPRRERRARAVPERDDPPAARRHDWRASPPALLHGQAREKARSFVCRGSRWRCTGDLAPGRAGRAGRRACRACRGAGVPRPAAVP